MSNNHEVKQPTPTFTGLEPVWTYQERLNKLDSSLNIKIDALEECLSEKFTNELELERKRLDSFTSLATYKLATLQQETATLEKVFNNKYENHLKEVNNYKLKLQNEIENNNNQIAQKLTNISNSVNSFTSRAQSLEVVANDTPTALNLTFTNLLNEKTSFKFDKTLPDDKTIVKSADGRLSVNYSFNTSDFKLDSKNRYQVTGLHLQSGRSISADKIYNDLNNATYNIGTITSKLESVLAKLSQVNHYVVSNNFKKDKVGQDTLDEFAIKCLSSNQAYITREQIPIGMRVKNTHNNHIWVFNELKVNNQTIFKWEDFGSDMVCTADNKGTLGLVTGSNERLRGYIDINGIISINGLEEELTNILDTLKILEDDLQHYESTLSQHLDHIDARLDALEGR